MQSGSEELLQKSSEIYHNMECSLSPCYQLIAVAVAILFTPVQSLYKYDHFLGRDDALNARILQVWYITRATEEYPNSAAHRAVK